MLKVSSSRHVVSTEKLIYDAVINCLMHEPSTEWENRKNTHDNRGLDASVVHWGIHNKMFLCLNGIRLLVLILNCFGVFHIILNPFWARARISVNEYEKIEIVQDLKSMKTLWWNMLPVVFEDRVFSEILIYCIPFATVNNLSQIWYL